MTHTHFELLLRCVQLAFELCVAVAGGDGSRRAGRRDKRLGPRGVQLLCESVDELLVIGAMRLVQLGWRWWSESERISRSN